MLERMTLEDQYGRAAADDMRILIVGAGIAGLTAAQMLRADGRNPVLIERSLDGAHEGYMLALMPMADAALDDLDVRDAYVKHSTPLARYGMRRHTGEPARVDSMSSILQVYGDYRGIERASLMDVLAQHGGGVTLGASVAAIAESQDGVTATIETREGRRDLEFDLVIAADGINSTTRGLVLAPQQVDVVDTEWGGWVAWIAPDADMDLAEELWGAGFFIGSYPVLDRIGVFIGGPNSRTARGPRRFVDDVRGKLNTVAPRVERTFETVVNASDPYYWPMTDCRAPSWVCGRVVLLGDAAAGFMPTAGIGAGMAMESAWVLTRILRHAQRDTLAPLLAAYERTQRPRVAAAQETSRRLAGLMFRQNTVLARLRDLATKMISVDRAIRPILRLLQSPPDPDGIADAALSEHHGRTTAA